jgi:hypothetical protein
MNKKNNEFASYNQASKNLELKMRSLNEAYGINKPVELLNSEKKESLMVEMTDAMKASIARYREIMNNSAHIMNENNVISKTNTGCPEAPKTTSFSTTIGAPFNNAAKAELDKDLKTTANDPEKQGEPFGDNAKTEEYKDAQYVPDGSVANKKPSGGKVVRVNEACEETVEECDEWGSCGLPTTAGVGEVNEDVNDIVGFADDETVSEGDDIDLDDVDMDLDDEESEEVDMDLDDPEADDIDLDDEESEEVDMDLDDPEEDDVDGDALDIDLEVEDENEIAALKAEIDELRRMIEDLKSEDAEDEYELEIDTNDNDNEDEDMDFEEDDDDSEYGLEIDDEEEDDEKEEAFKTIEESFCHKPLNENGTKLHVFGQHPGYRKKPMNLPKTGSDNENGNKDWNDNSVYSEEPFGNKIGSSAPFDKVVDASVNAIMESIKKKI